LCSQVFRAIIVAIAVISLAAAVPTPNDIVPETKLVDVATGPRAEAEQIVAEMIQSGADWANCTDLAETTRTEVIGAVEVKQKMLDSLDKGCGCKDEGQDEVNRTHTVMTETAKTVITVKEELTTATNADVQVSSQSYSFLTAGECGWIKTDAAYTAAETVYTKAVELVRTTTVTHELTITEHTNSVIKAKEMKELCECGTQSAHANEWTTANMDNEANQRAWAQSRHIDCVIAHTSEADCVVDSCPVVTKPVLCDAIETKECEEAGSPSGSTSIEEAGAPSGSATGSATNVAANVAATALSEFVQHTTGQECGTGGEHSNETNLGKAENLEDCARRCAAQEGCNYLSIGTGAKLNNCYWEHDVACSVWADNVSDEYNIWVKRSFANTMSPQDYDAAFPAGYKH